MENEILLEDTTLGYDDTSSDEVSSIDENSLEERLDRVEALLNENITLMETMNEEVVEDQLPVTTESGSVTTSSGVVENPDYAQYIYDLLLDSNIKVEVVQEQPTFATAIKDMPLNVQFEIIGVSIGLCILAVAFINKYTPKRR